MASPYLRLRSRLDVRRRVGLITPAIDRFPQLWAAGAVTSAFLPQARNAQSHLVHTLFHSRWTAVHRLTARLPRASVPSTKPPDGRHARRGRQALLMFLEVSSSQRRGRAPRLARLA